ncbi:uncharacterized protein LOC125946164 [Dermacentor silvarum]|uniref:uncharacterized protein LOC125946164 n=1 Tax=Dermacentor silvarum TaxID=543639 RepID=UPI002100F088|nr:uncharacterized protein LOC125946164 [Dermacentor silvarum]
MEKITSLNRGGSQSSESDVAAVAPDNPAKPAAVVPGDARKPSLATAERVAENPLQATGEDGMKTANAGAAKPATNKQSRTVPGLPVRSMVLVGILVVVIVAAFVYAIIFRAGRVLPRKAKRSAILANDTQ